MTVTRFYIVRVKPAPLQAISGSHKEREKICVFIACVKQKYSSDSGNPSFALRKTSPRWGRGSYGPSKLLSDR